MSDNPLLYGNAKPDQDNPLNQLDRLNSLALGPLYVPREATPGVSAGAGPVSPQVPKEFTRKADALATAEGKRTIDATGIHFLDGDKPVYAWNGADPTPVLGSRASELKDYPSVNSGGFNVWYKPGQEARAQQVLELSQQLARTDRKSPEAQSLDRDLGLALGYPADNVASYIRWKYGSAPPAASTGAPAGP